ncbi:sensor domain-containing diguanylate cyclase [Pseudomonas japonica]|uniref:sensor domain-containing diguanylate cyclase n=1 Tax=Pseudomonas japonica TaxID=256466 RepID=UPI0015E347CB|nr:sensor domain-containing diguanylate cyclase [Pseudomonas japonica]MBA1290378.1 GGDEF domain-containing protein [Pseudomonas japonica]
MPGRKALSLSPRPAVRALIARLDQPGATFGLTLTFMLLVILTFSAVEGWRAWRDYRQAYAIAENSVTNLARATAQHAEDAIRQVDILTGELRERVEGDGLSRMDVPRIHALMQEQAKVMPQLHGLFIYGPEGQWMVTDKDQPPDTANNADRDYFIYHRTHADRSVRIGEVVRSRSTGELIIPVSRRLNTATGEFAGVLLGTIKVSYFVDYYGAFKIDDRGALVLALRDGTILVRRPFDPAVVGQSLKESEIFKRYLPLANVGVAEVKAVVDGTRRLYGYRALERYPLVVEAGLSRQSFVGPWRADLFKTGLVLLLLIGVLTSFGALVLRQLRQRIRAEKAIRLAHQTVSDMAMTDSLTGIGNRRRLDQALAQEIARARRQGTSLALIMLDVDHFKRYNDRYGHAAGDDCLRQVAAAIRQALKRPADLAVRYGGEEFTALLPDTDAAGAASVAEQILQDIRALDLTHSDHPLGIVTVSAGIALTTPAKEETTPEGLIKAADALLYLAKHSGRNRAACRLPRETPSALADLDSGTR